MKPIGHDSPRRHDPQEIRLRPHVRLKPRPDIVNRMAQPVVPGPVLAENAVAEEMVAEDAFAEDAPPEEEASNVPLPEGGHTRRGMREAISALPDDALPLASADGCPCIRAYSVSLVRMPGGVLRVAFFEGEGVRPRSAPQRQA